MRFDRRLNALACVVAVAVMLVAACTKNDGVTPAPTGPSQALKVVSTIYPVTFFAERIGGDRVAVLALVPAGVEAHDFEPKPSDLRSIKDAAVVVYSHREFERWMSRALETVGGTRTVVEAAVARPLTDEEELLEQQEAEDDAELLGEDVVEGAGGAQVHDPHVWLDPLAAVEMARRVLDGLVEADPAGADLYRANTALLIRELQALHSEYRAALAACALKEVVVSHEAYGHMAERYGFTQLALAGLSAEAEGSPQRVAGIVTSMRALGVKHVLVEPVLSDALAKSVAAEAGAALLPLHPLEVLTPVEVKAGDDYFSVMEENLESLKTALACGA